jgi:Xaa-Pro aminopeptidase
VNDATAVPEEILARLRAASGGRLKDAEIRRLLAGIAGAPPPLERGRWFALVADQPEPDLIEALDRLISPAAGAKMRPNAAARLASLRAELARLELSGFLVPHADEQQNEYIPPRAERLAWLTGFTGSAGFAMALAECAALFVDGRY